MFYPDVVRGLGVRIVNQQEIDVMGAVSFGAKKLYAVAFVFRIQWNDVDANFGVLFFEFRYVFWTNREGQSVEI